MAESIIIAHPTVLTLNLPSFTILALDSQLTHHFTGTPVSHRYDKLIQLRPCVFLGCFGNLHLIDQIRDVLLADPPQNPKFVGDLAIYVQNTVNMVLGNARDEENGDGGVENTVELVLIGRCELDSRSYVFNISKGPNTWMCFAKRNVEKVATATTSPIAAVTRFIEKNGLDENIKKLVPVLDENVKEEDAMKYAWQCMRYASKSSWYSGGKIQVVVVKPGSSVVHACEPEDPKNCNNAYIYQGERRSQGY